MNRNNDSDMKIYVKKRESEQSDFDGLARNIDFHKENGNKQKAEDLGRELAKLKPRSLIFRFPKKTEPRQFSTRRACL